MKFSIFLISFFISPFLLAAPQPGDFFAQGPTNVKKISLTFDDGPGKNTEKFLDLLDRYRVKATFFMLGQQGETRPKVARMVASLGHEIGSHTYNHVNYLKKLKSIEKKFGSDPDGKEAALAEARGELLSDMRKSRGIIEKAAGRKVRLCRMPHGIDRPWIKGVAKEDGVILVNWTFGEDWNQIPFEKMKADYIHAVKPGAILLFHDDGKNWVHTLQILEAVIKAAHDGGFAVVPVGELIDLK